MMSILSILAVTASLAMSQATPPPTDGTSNQSSISGTVRDGVSGAPMPGVQIAIEVGRLAHALAVTDQNGRYEILAQKPGPIRLVATAPSSPQRYFGPRAARVLALSPGQKLAGIDIHLFGHGQISGKVVNERGVPVQLEMEKAFSQ